MSMHRPKFPPPRWQLGLAFLLIAAGSDSRCGAGGDDAEARRSERSAIRKTQNQRLANEHAERERRDLVAFGNGTVDERIRLCVRKHLRRLEGDTAGASLLAEPVGDLPPADFQRLDGVLAFLAEDGSLPPPPLVIRGTRHAQQWARIDKAWTACLEELQQRQPPGAPLVEEFQDSVRLFKALVPTPSDRTQRLSLEADVRNLEQLSKKLRDLRGTERLGQQLAGFPGGTVNDLVTWVLGLNLSARAGTVGHQHLRRVGLALVTHYDRSRGRERVAPDAIERTEERFDEPSEPSPFDNEDTSRPSGIERPAVSESRSEGGIGPAIADAVIRPLLPAVPAGHEAAPFNPVRR